jgi:branched-subunit amino acid transport protein
LNEFLIILGMAVVTLIPRWLPVFIIGRFSFPKRVNDWLGFIPSAALGALIFPGILSVDAGNPSTGLIGGLVAALLAAFRAPVLLVIAGSILTVMILKGG